MNSVNSSFTLRVQHDSLGGHLAAFRTALELYGTASLGDFLPASEHPRYREILCEMVLLELNHGWQSGQPKTLQAYQEAYPELFTDAHFLYKLTLAEFRLRQEAGDNPSFSDYRQRYGLGVPEESSQTGPAREPLGKTRPNPGSNPAPAKRLSDPDIILELNEVMLSMPEVGSEIFGFQLIAELGKGAFGKVFLAEQPQLAGRYVALKVASDLFHESQTLAQLQHTHIVPIYSFHDARPFQAVCMPYLGSTTIAHVLEHIRRQKRLPDSGKGLLSTLHARSQDTGLNSQDSGVDSQESGVKGQESAIRGLESAGKHLPTGRPSDACLLAMEMSYVDAVLYLGVRLADGLQHAHARGILHRDLKPANILLTDEGLPMLVDFNLAKNSHLRCSAAAASIGGTLPYMAPEHLEAFRGQGVPVDARSDLYSLGVILFELLTGVAPFPTYRKLPLKEVIDRMIHDRKKPVPALRSLNKSIPRAVESILRRCLHPEPQQRYQSAQELHEDLQNQLEHRPLRHAPNTSLWERTQKLHRRHPRLSWITLAAVSLAALIGMSSLFVVRDRERATLAARDKLVRFHDDAQSAYFWLHAATAKQHLAEGERVCRATLAHFEVLDNPLWQEAPAFKRLSEVEQSQLQDKVGEMLVLLAHAQQLAGDSEPEPDRRKQRYHAGLQFCSLAEGCLAKQQTVHALWEQRGELHKGLLNREKAEECFERARQAKLKTAQDLYLTARLLAQKEKLRDALALIQQAIRLKPQDYHLHFLQGICHDHLAQHAEAVACYHTCIALRPKFFAGYYNRGLTYLRQVQFPQAEQDFDEVVRLRPDFADAYLHRGIVRQGLKRYADADADFTEAIARGHEQTRLYFLRAKVREKAGNLAGAKSDHAEGLKREPCDELSWIARGIAFVSVQPKQALGDFEQAIKCNSRSLPALQNKAHVLAKYLKRTQDAVTTLDRAIQLYPENACLRAGRGVYLARLGKRGPAIKDAEQALALDKNPANLYHVAGIYALTSAEKADDNREAMRLLSTALKSGFGFDYLEIDRDLDPIRQSPVFRSVVEAARALQAPLRAKKPM